MKRTWVGICFFSCLMGCDGGNISSVGPDQTPLAAVTFRLVADETQALCWQDDVAFDECHNEEPYPNPLGCDELIIEVEEDGGMTFRCSGEQGEVLFSGYVSGRAATLQGLPFNCEAKTVEGVVGQCLVCRDVFASYVLNSCGELAVETCETDGATLPPLGDPDRGLPGEDTDEEPQDPCSAARAVATLETKVNELLSAEGLGRRWSYRDGLAVGFCSPSADIQYYYDQIERYKSWGPSWAREAERTRQALEEIREDIRTQCTPDGLITAAARRIGPLDASAVCGLVSWWKSGLDEGQFCRTDRPGHAACFCGRMPLQALVDVCQAVLPECLDNQAYRESLAMAHQVLLRSLPDLISKPSRFVEIPAIVFNTDEFPEQPPTAIPPALQCLASPLVLDLAGDGIAPTSREAGVSFDLLGSGLLKTAWIQGDDALLVFDQNGNGLIDSGAELFGEATILFGRPMYDAFAALAALDSHAYGGNGDGRLDENDFYFDKLQLWQDRNRDGIAQPGELLSLAEAGIASIHVTPTQRTQTFDAHGNDIGTQGFFTRRDGSPGLMIDVYFRTGRD